MQHPKKFACSLCRRRKLKCDGQRPICMTCRRLGHSCTYEEYRSEAQLRSVTRTRPQQQPAIQSAILPLGIQEPLPDKGIIDKLHVVFFDDIHPFLPVLHIARYLIACQTSPNVGTPACLRYAVWCLAASALPKYDSLAEAFYKRARTYAEGDELKGLGLSVLTVEHVQCWTLLSQYESQKMAFPRAWMSVGRAARLAQMLGLHQVDKEVQISKQVLPPARDWIELETRRRTFWAAFHNDRWATCGTGWPVTIDDREVSTNLPSSNEAYLSGIPEFAPSLYSVRAGRGISKISTFGGAILIADLVGRIREHLHFEDHPDLSFEAAREAFRSRHVKLDNDLSSLFLSLPYDLRLTAGVRGPAAVSVNMNIHSLVISLHRAMILKLEQSEPDYGLITRSQARCDMAVDEIINILRLISHVDLSKMSPYTAFGLSVAATVLIPKAKRGTNQDDSNSNLQFIRSAMQALTNAHPITGSFLLQLDLAMASSGLHQDPASSQALSRNPVDYCSPQDIKNSSGPTNSGPMVDELKKYNALPITLDGILPTNFRDQKPRQCAKTSANDSVFPSKSKNDTFGDLDISDDTIADWLRDESLAMEADINQSDPSWEFDMLINNPGLDQINPNFLLDPLNLGISQDKS